ncbi:MAG: RND transporter [Pirellulales bacterium]
MIVKNAKVLCMIAIASAWFAGCNQSAQNPDPASEPPKVTDSGHIHGEWWCSEHGVPEEICAQCDTKLVADFKAKGDWCKEHDRPDSQCFICHPEKEAEFAAQYEAKYGEKPPKPEVGGVNHEHAEEKEKS